MIEDRNRSQWASGHTYQWVICHPEYEAITLKRKNFSSCVQNDGRHIQQGDPSEWWWSGQGEQEREEEGQRVGDKQVKKICSLLSRSEYDPIKMFRKGREVEKNVSSSSNDSHGVSN